MEEHVDILEKIDRYILNQMTEEERESFEKELSSDSALMEEYRMQQEIILATQRVSLKKHLQSIEKQQSIRNVSRIRIVKYLSIAAAVVAVCMIGVDMRLSADISATSQQYFAEMAAPITRGDDDISRLICQVHDAIGRGDLESARENIAIAEIDVNSQLLNDAETAEEKYHRSIVLIQKQEIEWYKALVYMLEGEIFKSRKALQNISGSDSRYSDDAKEILETINLF